MKTTCHFAWSVPFLFIIALFTFTAHRPVKMAVERIKLTGEQKRLSENAEGAFKVAEGLKVALFASEPMLTNPTNIDIDHRGRIWITEGYNYRINLNPTHPVKNEGDRILILEDTDGDGRADTSKVFYQDTTINAALGIAVLGNKVIVSCSPYVFVLTDSNGDDVADKKEILFQGIGGKQHDHAIHAFTFGPDGKLYFNFGNFGDSIMDRNGKVIRDIEGTPVNATGKPYRQGMVFRCNEDGSDFEVLAHNFRNNYEVAVDAYGNMWQSDNDDDGNRGVRINYILEYGNYGYTDEMTGAGWRSRRINMEDSIPLQHWHLNDPGVVPNLLQTGAGSPTGMLVYEGNLLPQQFRGQMIHSEPGHNVVRSYPVQKAGAGYRAELVNILESADDKWFRPADVCVAPDGSLFVADWYDPGVGGHQVGDLDKGRIYRVAPDVSAYRTTPMRMNSIDEALLALESPNLATRYLAWKKLHQAGKSAEKSLVKSFTSAENPRHRARAFWLLARLPGKEKEYINKGLSDRNEDIRTAALKAARQSKMDIMPFVKQVMNDASPHVRREAIIALRHVKSSEAPALWASLARQYDGEDRWYLEALGVSADRQWDSYFNAWVKSAGEASKQPAGRDIVWRARTASALPMLAKIIQDPTIDPSKNLKYFRAFDFHSGPQKQQVLLSLMKGNHPQQKLITVYSLIQLDTSRFDITPEFRATLNSSLEAAKGTQEFLDIVAKYNITNQNNELLNIALRNNKREAKTTAVRMLIANDGADQVAAAIEADTANAMNLVNALGSSEDTKIKDLLESVLLNKNLNMKVRQRATQMYYNGWNGQGRLMALVMNKKLPPELDTTAEKLLLGAWRQDIKQKATAFYKKDAGKQQNLQPLETLAGMKGNAEAGKALFNTTCTMCHQVNNNGINFGPDLSGIGAKLSKEALYKAVLYPDEGISFGYEGFVFKLKDGNQVLGYITSETKDDLSVKTMGGAVTRIKKTNLISRKAYEHSLMPAGLVSGMKQQQVVDLVEYMAMLGKQ